MSESVKVLYERVYEVSPGLSQRYVELRRRVNTPEEAGEYVAELLRTEGVYSVNVFRTDSEVKPDAE